MVITITVLSVLAVAVLVARLHSRVSSIRGLGLNKHRYDKLSRLPLRPGECRSLPIDTDEFRSAAEILADPPKLPKLR